MTTLGQPRLEPPGYLQPKVREPVTIETTDRSLRHPGYRTVFWALLKQFWYALKINLNKPVKQGGDYYNADLVTLQGHPCKLSDYVTKGRPLVIAFGSIS